MIQDDLDKIYENIDKFELVCSPVYVQYTKGKIAICKSIWCFVVSISECVDYVLGRSMFYLSMKEVLDHPLYKEHILPAITMYELM